MGENRQLISCLSVDMKEPQESLQLDAIPEIKERGNLTVFKYHSDVPSDRYTSQVIRASPMKLVAALRVEP